MNLVIVMGRLTNDPEVKTTQTGKTVVRFSIAVNEGKTKDGAEKVQYFNITAWDKQGEVISTYAKKGSKLLVEGSLQNRSWDKPDGTKGYATDILLNRFQFVGSKSDSVQGEPSGAPAAPAAKTKSMSENGLPDINIDDINIQMPF